MNPDAQAPKKRASSAKKKLAGKPVVRAGDSPAKRGGDLRKANEFKRTATFKRAEAAAKPARQSDASSSGPGYGKTQAKRFVADAHKAVARAKADKPFSLGALAGAVDLGVAKDLKVVGDYAVLRKRRAILPDYDKVLDPRKGGTASIRDKSARDVIDQQVMGDSLHAPAVKVLDQTLRPTRAIASATDEIVQGHGVGKALSAGKRGLVKNEGVTFSKVLKDVGAPKGVQTVGGFVLDVAADPATYLTVGAGPVARNTAMRAAKKATADALKKGASRKAADRAGRAAAKTALAGPKTNKGIQVGARVHVPFTDKGVSVKTSGRASAAVSRKLGVSKAATATRNSRLGQGVGNELVHDFRPKERTVAQHATVRAAQREHRAATTAARRQAPRDEKKLRGAAGKDSEQIIDAIESGAPLKTLGAKAVVAREARKMLGEAYDAKKAAELLDRPFTAAGAADAQRYFPHTRRMDLEPGVKGKTKNQAGSVKVKAEKGRTIHEPLAAIRQKDPALFSDDLPRVVAGHKLVAREKAALADYWKKVASTGRRLTPASEFDSATELVYRVEPHGLKALVKEGGEKIDMSAIAAALKDRDGRYVILPKKEVARAEDHLRPGVSPTGPGRVFDKVQGTWKTVVTVPMPSYHARNLMGDSMNAFLGDASAASYKDAIRIIGGTRRANTKSAKTLGAKPIEGGLLDVGGVKMTRKQLLDEAERHGAIGQGFLSRELSDLTGNEPGRLARLGQGREDIPRLATYLSARRRGMAPREAAEWANKHHFDYGDLTMAERQARRFFPFYTFWARNTRLQAEKLFTRPGKAATLAKALDESAKAAGFEDYDDYAGQLPEYQQRGLAVPIRIGGKVHSVSIAPPATDLNQLTADPVQQVQNAAQRFSQVKMIGELLANYSVFFRGPIERDDQKLVPAPAVMENFPAFMRKKLGVRMYNDPRRGRILGWSPKVDYVFRQLPETNLLTQTLTPVPGSRNMGRGAAAFGALTGAKVTRFDWQAQDNRISQLGKRQHELEAKAEFMRDTGDDRTRDNVQSPAYRKVLDEIAAVKKKREALKKARGDKIREPAKKPANEWGAPSKAPEWGETPSTSSGWGG